MKKSKLLAYLIALLFIVSLCTPISAQAAMPETAVPMASDYLLEYNANIYAMGGGDLEIWFDVSGTRTWADLGVLTIQLYESLDNQNWYWIKTYSYEDYDGMLEHNTNFCMNYVSYEGVPGRYYKAYVEIYGGSEDGGDSRYFWTPVERCT